MARTKQDPVVAPTKIGRQVRSPRRPPVMKTEPKNLPFIATPTVTAPKPDGGGAAVDRELANSSDSAIWHSVVGLLSGSTTYRQAVPDVEVMLAMAAGAQQHAYSDDAVRLTQRARDLMSRIAIESGVRRSVLDEGALGAVEVAELLASNGRNTRDRASRLRRKGELLGVDVAGRVLYPAFQIDAARAALRPGVGEANQLLNALEDPWGVASWWLSPHGRLRDGQRPADLALEGDTATLAAIATSAVAQD